MLLPEKGPKRNTPERQNNSNGTSSSNGSARAYNGSGDRERPRGQPIPAILTASPNLPALLKALQRRWLIASTLAITLAAAATAAVWYFLPPGNFTGSIKLYMPVNPQGMFFKHPEADENFEYYQQTQAALVRSRMVLKAALSQAKEGQTPVAELSIIRSSPTPLAMLEKELKVDFPGSREIMRISFDGDNPRELKILVEAVAEAYLTEVVNVQTKRRKNRLEVLDKLLADSQKQLKELREKVRKLAENLGSGDNQTLALKQRLAQDQLNRASRELIDLESEVRMRQIEEITLMAQEGKEFQVPEKEIIAQLEKDPEVQKHRARASQLEELLEETKAKATPGKEIKALQTIKNDLDRVQKALEDRRKLIRPSTEKELRERLRTDAAAQLIFVRSRINERLQLKKVLEEEIERLGKETLVLNKGTLDLEEYLPEIKEAETARGLYLAEKQHLIVEMDDPPRVTRLPGEEAIATRPDERIRRLRFAGPTGLGVFALVALGIAFLEFRARRIDSVEQVTMGLGMKVVGKVPACPRRLGLGLLSSRLAEENWRAFLADAVDATRTILLHATESSSVKAVMVTSATGGEGKSSFSVHLAVSLARAGRTTLLLDADLRNPSCHELFELAAVPGFAELLREDCEVESALQSAPVDGLQVVAAGKCDSKSLRLLSQPRVAELLNRFRERFDFIIIDTSPILPVPDALQIGQCVDGVLFSTLREVSRLPRVYEAYRRVESLDIPVLGVVVNGTRDETYSAYGRRYAAVRRN